jgi:hypothetical protein
MLGIAAPNRHNRVPDILGKTASIVRELASISSCLSISTLLGIPRQH